jgi:phosphomannomutase
MDHLNLSMFRSNDIRTRASRLTDDLALRLARAEACYIKHALQATGVVLAHDARGSGPHMLEIAVRAYTEAGLDCVVLPGITGVCQFYYAAMRHSDLAGVFIGASHNPATDTGRKLIGPCVTPLAQGIGPQGGLTQIEHMYRDGVKDESSAPGRIYAFDATPGYIAYSLRLAQVQPGALGGLRILHDYLHAAGGRELMLGFAAADCNLTPLHFTADPSFPLGDPNPVKQNVIAEGLAVLSRGEHDLGMFYDGDADRLDVYLSNGVLLSSSFVYAAILPLILRRMTSPKHADLSPIASLSAEQRPVVFADTKSSPVAEAEMARLGVDVRLVRSGHSHIKHAMSRNEAAIGTVEESAHFYEAFPYEGHRYCTENTLYFSLLIARAFKESPQRFEHMAELQAGTGREREWGHVFPDDELRAAALAAVREHFGSSGAEIVSAMADGTPMQADLLRYGLPPIMTPQPPAGVGRGEGATADSPAWSGAPDSVAHLAPNWFQISQRESQSEDHLARWEVLAADQALANEIKAQIQRIVSAFRAGPEYQG